MTRWLVVVVLIVSVLVCSAAMPEMTMMALAGFVVALALMTPRPAGRAGAPVFAIAGPLLPPILGPIPPPGRIPLRS